MIAASLDQCGRDLSHAVRDGVNARQYTVPQNLGLKSQDRDGAAVLYNGMTNAHAIKLLQQT